MTRPTDAEILAAIGGWGWAEVRISPDWRNKDRPVVEVEWRRWERDSTEPGPVQVVARDTIDDALRAVVEGEKP